MEVVGQIWQFITERADKGITPMGVYGSRRCSKTWTISQFALYRAYDFGEEWIFASMTETQGDAGAFSDCKNIIATNDAWVGDFTITNSPRRITCNVIRDRRYGKIVFRSFRDSATAKGAACDWIYINEANKFTEQQYYALTANARKGVIVDYNPEESEFWAERLIKRENLLHAIWQWNRKHLTQAQLQWFADLKERAESEDATSADIAFYKRYYLGEYAGIQGTIFTPANIRSITRDRMPEGVYRHIAFVDPSALRGADYFAMALGCTDGEVVYVVDTYSENEGNYYQPARVLQGWKSEHPDMEVYIETNGLQGIEFYEFCQASEGLEDVRAWTSKGNKFERITANYQALTGKVVFVEYEGMQAFLAQVYAFDKKCEHDDNIDAVNSLLMAYRIQGLVE